MVICTIVLVSFLIFAVDQTKTASNHQAEAVSGPSAAESTSSAASTSTHENVVHRVIDDASEALTAPFDGVAGSGSEWASRSVELLLALAVYGFGLGYLARALRVRV